MKGSMILGTHHVTDEEKKRLVRMGCDLTDFMDILKKLDFIRSGCIDKVAVDVLTEHKLPSIFSYRRAFEVGYNYCLKTHQ